MNEKWVKGEDEKWIQSETQGKDISSFLCTHRSADKMLHHPGEISGLNWEPSKVCHREMWSGPVKKAFTGIVVYHPSGQKTTVPMGHSPSASLACPPHTGNPSTAWARATPVSP